MVERAGAPEVLTIEERPRLQARLDYRVNLKAEIEIASLHEKIDHLLNVQWSRMLEVQETQLEMLAEITERRRR